jgi:hypothetical protein
MELLGRRKSRYSVGDIRNPVPRFIVKVICKELGINVESFLKKGYCLSADIFDHEKTASLLRLLLIKLLG